jgi:hypothetical protein
MNFTIKRKNFDVGKPKHKTTLSLTGPMYESLVLICKQTNQSVPEVITDALEQWLTNLAEQTVIPYPNKKEEKLK